MLDCAIATTLPSTIDSTDSTISIPCQSIAMPWSAPDRRRSVSAKPANSGAVPISSVIAVGAPS